MNYGIWVFENLGITGLEMFTALSYLSIPLSLQYLRISMCKKRVPSPVAQMHFMLQVFIIGCALVHFLGPLVPVYNIVKVLQQLLRIATPLFAVLTSTSIYFMVPCFLSMPSTCQLQQLNEDLQQHRDNLHKEVAQRTHELLQEKAKWKMITEQSPQILWLKNTKGDMEYYNNRWYEYTGLTPEENGFCRRAIHPADLEVMHKKWVEGQCSTTVSDYKIRIKAANGDYRWHLVRCVPLRDIETNDIIQYCGISTDIHDTEMVNELSMADATRKARFLAMISHEMRTPLSGIIGMSTLLGDTALQQSQAEILHNVKISADKLLNLVNNILDLFKMHNDKLTLEVSTFELQDCVQEALSAVREDATQKKITLHDEIDHRMLPSLVQADRVRLKQVLGNLLSNAVKFTHEGGDIYISAIQDRSDSKSVIKFSVRDTGIGIPEHDMVKVFETFTQLDTSSTRRFGGTGVGLAISKGLVELMRGTIWCESEPGKGATFFFTFEVADVTNESVVRSSGTNKAPIASTPLLYASTCDDILDNDGAIISDIASIPDTAPVVEVTESEDDDFVCIVRPRILVVDDTEMNQKVLKRYLVSLGYTDVDAVYDGEQAVKAVSNNQQPYDVIFLDMEMPVMDGVTAAKHIRNLPQTELARQPHIIAVTANAFQEDVEKCLDAGMCVHMAKPLKRDDLKKKMERALQILCGNVGCGCHQYHHSHHHPHSHNNVLLHAPRPMVPVD